MSLLALLCRTTYLKPLAVELVDLRENIIWCGDFCCPAFLPLELCLLLEGDLFEEHPAVVGDGYFGLCCFW